MSLLGGRGGMHGFSVKLTRGGLVMLNLNGQLDCIESHSGDE
jgi:hypothetical protein